MKRFKHLYKLIFLGSIIIVVSLLLSMHLSLFLDESFSMGLIRHSYIHLIYIDSLDVHPPLYYILLKLFLSITTFWTKSFIFKIIFARVFSVLLLLGTFCVLYRTLKIMRLKVNPIFMFLLTFIISLMFKETTNIRMYPLSAFLISFCVLNLVGSIYTHKNKYIFGLIVVSILSFYTHDFSAIISGLLILISFMYDLKSNNLKEALKLFFVGLIVLIAYIPWLFVAINQAKDMPANYWITITKVFESNLFIALIMLIFIIPLIFYRKFISKKNKKILNIFNIVNIIFIIIELSISIINKPIFTIRYSYPFILTYVFISVALIIKLRKHIFIGRIKYSNMLIILLCLISIFVVYKGCISQKSYHIQSVRMIRIFNTSHEYINLKLTKKNEVALPLYSICAQYSNKYLSKKDYQQIINNKGLLRGTNKKLLYKIYYNKKN